MPPINNDVGPVPTPNFFRAFFPFALSFFLSYLVLRRLKGEKKRSGEGWKKEEPIKL